jgi:MauM/NapG family ferredoxin protein
MTLQYPTSASKRVRLLRRISQALFLTAFVVLLYLTEFSFTSSKNPGQTILPSPLLKLFFDIDPLTGIATGISSWIIYGSLLLGLIVLLATIFFGRFFCGWVCPLGTINQMCSSFSSERDSRKGKRLIESNKYHKYQAWKYYILIGLLALALLGSVQIGLFDPISIAARSIGLVLIPALNATLTGLGNLLANSPFRIISLAGKAIFFLGSGILIYFKQPHFHGIFWLALIFVAILTANRVFTRFWCRGICPLGAIFGLISRHSIFGLFKDNSKCNNCNLCLLHCQGGDNPQGGVPHQRAECHLCLNCLAVCPENVISFRFQSSIKQYNPAPDLTLRRTVLAGIVGLAAYPVLRSGDTFVKESSFIRPPGSLIEEDFLKRCIRCGQCMKICPTNALHPALLETGWEGIFTPILIPRIGYCEHSCVLCGHACPTGAIAKLTPQTKFGNSDKPPLKIGTAFFDKGRCLAWGMGVPCIVCEEWCPTSPKAIWLEETEVVGRDGASAKIKLPHLDSAKCTGCGVCEKVCPVSSPAVYITSAGESRDPRKSLLLER